jgi:hypothetical protein
MARSFTEMNLKRACWPSRELYPDLNNVETFYGLSEEVVKQ